MNQQFKLPQSPEEVAACLSQLTEREQCIVKGVIIGINEARTTARERSAVSQTAAQSSG